MARESRRYDSTSQDGRNVGLPPIRELLGAELGRGPPPYVRSGYPSSSAQWMRTSVPEARIKLEYGAMPVGMHTPYPRASSLAGSPGDSYSFHRPYTTFKHEDRDEHRMSTEGYSYAVLRTSAVSGSLTDAIPPSDRPQGIIRQTSAPSLDEIEDTSKRYKCDYCGKRFAMPSHYQIHLRSHTAERPFVCDYPGCDRAFTVKGNLTRHLRTHTKGEFL